MSVSFELDGQLFTALNGGPHFKFNEAISFQVYCDTQKDVDDYWAKLSRGGDEKAQQCGRADSELESIDVILGEREWRSEDHLVAIDRY